MLQLKKMCAAHMHLIKGKS